MRIDRNTIERASIELIGDRAELRFGRRPIIERALQRRPFVRGHRPHFAIPANYE
jgi:hypothetical protein